MLFHVTGLIQTLALYKTPPYDPFRDLLPLALIGRQATALAVSASSPYTTLQALGDAVRARPADFSFGSYGNGSTSHIYGELLRATWKVDIPHVPYRGEGPLLPELMTGRTPMAFVSAATAVTRQKDRTLRILAVAAPRRTPMLPDVPTFAEQDIQGFDLTGWFGLFVSSATPQAIVQKMTADVRQVLNESEISTRLRDLALEPASDTPPEITRFMKEDQQRWAALIRRFNITLE